MQQRKFFVMSFSFSEQIFGNDPQKP